MIFDGCGQIVVQFMKSIVDPNLANGAGQSKIKNLKSTIQGFPHVYHRSRP
jgi:hypothetical protein